MVLDTLLTVYGIIIHAYYLDKLLFFVEDLPLAVLHENARHGQKSCIRLLRWPKWLTFHVHTTSQFRILNSEFRNLHCEFRNSEL